MKFSVASVIATLAASASAIPAFTNNDFTLTPGSTFTLSWSNAKGPVSIVLATGPATNLVKVETIDSNDTSTSFVWSVPTNLATGSYAFEITDDTGTNYSKMFSLTGTGSASSSSVTGSTTTGTTTTSGSTSGSTSATTTGTTSSATTSHSTTTGSSNTTTKASSTSTKASATATTTPANTNNGPQAKSPLALVLVTVAALLYFN